MYFPLLRSTYSCLQAVPRPEQIVARLLELGLPGAALTDHGNLGGIPSWTREAAKKGLKAVAGMEFYIAPEGGPHTRLTVLSRNQDGWQALMKAATLSNNPKEYKDRPQIPLGALSAFSRDWFVLSGYPQTALAESIFVDPYKAYRARTEDDARTCLKEDWQGALLTSLDYHLNLFGSGLRLGVHVMDRENFPASFVIAEAIRWVGQRKSVPVAALTDSHYLRKEDAADQRVLLCTHLKTTFRDAEKALERDRDGLSRFFRSNRYYVPTTEELRAFHPESELAATLGVANACEPPRIGGTKHLPTFPCPEGKLPDDFLREQCREGWRKKIEPILKALPATAKADKRKEYGERVKMELEVLCGAGLSSYFLIVQDYIRHTREVMRRKVGPGRGSSSGSLCAFLLDITRVDPIKYDLLFERFYNAGRKDSYPDVDVDFEVGAREPLIAYLKEKYGPDNVCPIGTFSRLQGRSILKDVLKAHNRGSYDELNRITAPIPDEAAISDDLQTMREEEDEAGIILWALENRPGAFLEWVHRGPDGELDGPLSADFAQAIRLEGGARGMGKHASGYIISPVPVSDVVPLAYDKGGDGLMTGFGMKDVEGAGLTKCDLLGLAVLDRLSLFQRIVRTGR